MTNLTSPFLQLVQDRQYFHQCTDISGLDALMASGSVPAYTGFDCTAPALHVGSLVQIMLLRHVQKLGHKPIVLLGGGTTKVGDPSGRDETRKLLSDADIAANMAGIRRILEKFIRFGDGKTDAVLVNNADWLEGLSYISFLRDYGRYFSVNRMLTFDSVKLRLEREHHLSFLEFNYMVLQAYDFVELHKRHGCRLQFGGSDQWGNIVNGIELEHKMGGQKPLFGLTTPLITTSSGAKMGKTAQGAVWLDEAQVSPYDYWQFWRNTEDADVGRFLRLFTELPLAEIARLEQLKDNEINEAKKILATEATRLCHGEEAANAAAETARKIFEEGGLATGLPVIDIPKGELEKGIQAFDLFRKVGLATSGGEARKLIRGGGAKINDAPVTDEMQVVTLQDMNSEGVIKVSAGKKRHVLVKAAPL